MSKFCSVLVGVVALMAGALISSTAYAQCFGTTQAFPSVIVNANTAFLTSGSPFLSVPNSAPDQQAGGVWARTITGGVDTQANNDVRIAGTISVPAPVPGGSVSVPQSLNLPCRSKIEQSFTGVEAGHDIVHLNAGNSGMSWAFGVLAGYLQTDAKVAVPGDTTQNGNFEEPSVGLYTAFSKGNFFADVQARLYKVQAESLGERLDASGYSITGNTGYSFDLGGNWALEPSVGGVFSHTSFGQFDVANVTDIFSAPITIPGLPPITAATAHATDQIHDVESALGRASVKLGTTLPLDGGRIIASPFVTASVFHEFDGDATASLAVNGTFPGGVQFRGNGTLTANSPISTYGQFGVGSAFLLGDTGWLGYVRADYWTGDNIEGYRVNAGLRYQLNPPQTASLKDGGSMKDGPADATNGKARDWSGPYVGVSAGSTWGHMHGRSQGDTVDPDYAGYLVGGQAGYNFQAGRLVWGIEGDAGTSNSRGTCSIQPQLFSCKDSADTLGSLTARLGYTWGRALFYAKGGWAFGEIGLAPNGASSTNWENGWTAGGGVEFALTNRWSAKAEYMHYEFPSDTFTVAQNLTSNATTAGETVQIGVNYHFWPR